MKKQSDEYFKKEPIIEDKKRKLDETRRKFETAKRNSVEMLSNVENLAQKMLKQWKDIKSYIIDITDNIIDNIKRERLKETARHVPTRCMTVRNEHNSTHRVYEMYGMFTKGMMSCEMIAWQNRATEMCHQRPEEKLIFK